jgi:hypothetical protein
MEEVTPLESGGRRARRVRTDMQAIREVVVVFRNGLSCVRRLVHENLAVSGLAINQDATGHVSRLGVPGPMASVVDEHVGVTERPGDALTGHAVVLVVRVHVTPSVGEPEAREQLVPDPDAVFAIIAHAIPRRIEA